MRKKKIELRYIIIFVVVGIIVLVGVLLTFIKTDKKLTRFESMVKDIVVSSGSFLSSPFEGIKNKLVDYSELKNVLEENKKLKVNVDKMASIDAENTELKKELKELKEELNIDNVLSDYTYLNATVISRNPNLWYNTITIDKGSHSGIKEDMVVINSTGLIGKITNVGAFSSDVKLITTNDSNNKISVTITNGDKKLTGLINGYNYKKGILEVEGISNTDKVNIGDMVYTSGLGGVFPSGVLVGKVSNITTDVYDLAKLIEVLPSAHFEDINYVTILKREAVSDANN